MKYVKLIARKDTWFKEGTEVYDYDCRPPHDLRRLTLAEWESWEPAGSIPARGLRVNENPTSEGGTIGEEYWDGEMCLTSEFDVEIVEEPR